MATEIHTDDNWGRRRRSSRANAESTENWNRNGDKATDTGTATQGTTNNK